MQVSQNNFSIKKDHFEKSLFFLNQNPSKTNIKFVDGKFKENLFGSTTKEKNIFKVVKFFSKSIAKDFPDIAHAKLAIKKELINCQRSEFLSLILLGKKELPKTSKMDLRQQIIHQIFAEAEKREGKYKDDLLNLIKDPVHPIITNVCKNELIYLKTETDFVSEIYPNFETKFEKGFKDYLSRDLLDPTDLEKFILNKTTRGIIENICNKNYSLESFEFILALQKYKKLSIEKQKDAGKQIIIKFLNGGVYQINISAILKSECIEKFQQGKDITHAFDKAKNAILVLLSRNFRVVA